LLIKRLQNKGLFKLEFGKEDNTCNICGRVCKLSRDHIFPKGLGLPKVIVIRSPLGSPLKYPDSLSECGLVQKTICRECNNLLGYKYDQDLIKLIKSASLQCNQMNNLRNIGLTIPNIQLELSFIPDRVARSVTGHLLAARVSEQGLTVPDMQKFVLEEEYCLPPNYHLYMWFCPLHDPLVTLENVYIHLPTMSALIYETYKVFPLAFLFSNNDMKISGSVDLLGYKHNSPQDVRIDMMNYPNPQWPENAGLPGAEYGKIIGANFANSKSTVYSARRRGY
jgi:hypothetical protein